MTEQQVRIFTSSDGQAQLFNTTPVNVLMHLQNIFKDEELAEQASGRSAVV